ncbi:MAG TPA: PEP-CTERM sorting domain-containing protein [Verrucomicrobiae bacterium]|nr:PEP-CTERM sorting domain-containing protein [Verrucomicrobiae bacterium]
MKTRTIKNHAVLIAATCGIANIAHAGTFQPITIDGDFSDWAGVPLAYTALEGPSDAIQYDDVYVANDADNLYIRFTLYSASPDAFANSLDNLFIDTDNNSTTGFSTGGIGSEALVEWGSGYQEKNGGFNEGGINGLGWQIAGSPDSMDFELAISRNATYASDGSPVFTGNTISILLEGDDSSYDSVEFAPSSGGIVYTFASVPEPATFTVAGLGLLLLMGRFLFLRRNSGVNG